MLPPLSELKPRALLFDLDGTLVDSVPDLAVAVDNTLEELGFDRAGEHRVREWVGNGAVKLIQRALAFAMSVKDHGAPVPESQHAKTANSANLNPKSFGAKALNSSVLDSSAVHLKTLNPKTLNPKVINQAHQLFLRHYQRGNGQFSRLYPGVRTALTYWQQQSMPMAIVTNKPIQFVPHLLAHLNIEQYFSVLVGGECTAQKKPSPMPLYYACQQLSVDPGLCLMIGDSRNDVQAARSAAMPVVAVSYGYNHGEPIELAQPDRVIDQLDELMG